MNLNELKEKRNLLLKELLLSEDWIIGSIIETTRVQSGKKRLFYYLSRSINGTTKTTYLSKANLPIFKKARKTGTRVKILINNILELNIQILKANGGKEK